MHILANHYRQEFLATPQLLRLDYASEDGELVPTLLLKASSLILKYIAQGSELEFILASCSDRILYAISVADDLFKPVVIWSIAEHDAERKAFFDLIEKGKAPLFLFNELALNIGWTTVNISLPNEAKELISLATLGQVSEAIMQTDARILIEGLWQPKLLAKSHYRSRIYPQHGWKETFNHYITNHAVDSCIHLFNSDEGNQQEQLALWLTDNLQPIGAIHSPQIAKGKRQRELTDLLLTHDVGTVLIESKTLTIFNRPRLPSRNELSRDVTKHIDKAIRQLRGAARKVVEGVTITNVKGEQLRVTRDLPLHLIVLIPEFDLIDDPTRYCTEFIVDFMKATKSFIHLVDISELMRIVQAAEMISESSETVTRMMAFDFYLTERMKKTISAGRLDINVLFRRA
jgi:hypothetical protein